MNDVNLMHGLERDSEQRIQSLRITLAYCQLYSMRCYIPLIRSLIAIEEKLLSKFKTCRA